MSIRRVGFNPFVSTASLVQAQRRVEAVEKHIGAEEAKLKTEEDGLESLNEHYRAELEALEAERAAKAKQVETLRSKLMLRDGYEKQLPEELVDLKGGLRDGLEEADPRTRDKPGVSLAQLARANVYERVSREEKAAAERAELARAEAELLAAERALAEASAPRVEEDVPLEEPSGQDDADWMANELEALERGEGLEEADADDEEVYSDPGADLFLASLDDIENLEPEQAGPDVNAFSASLDDIEHLETAPSAASPEAAQAPEAAAEPAPPAALLPFEDEAEAVVALPFDEDVKG